VALNRLNIVGGHISKAIYVA